MKHIYAILIIFIAFSSCRKKCYDASNSECENYNPCFGAEATSADFKIEENMYATKRFYECDTCIHRTLYFTAKQELDSYQWRIGNDPRLFGGKKFAMEFEKQMQFVDVQLIGWKKEPDQKCFPKDSGGDTVKKRVYFYKNEEWPVLGKYNGYYESNPNDTFTITVGYFPSTTPALKYYAVRGLKNDIYDYVTLSYERSIKAVTAYNFKIDQMNYLKDYIPKDAQLNKQTNKLYIEFLHSNGWNAEGKEDIEVRKFVGRKIN